MNVHESVLAFGMPGGWEWILIMIVALLLFGRRLPDVARSLGKSIVEFKKGIREVSEDIDTQSRHSLSSSTDRDQRSRQLSGETAPGGASKDPNPPVNQAREP